MEGGGEQVLDVLRTRGRDGAVGSIRSEAIGQAYEPELCRFVLGKKVHELIHSWRELRHEFAAADMKAKEQPSTGIKSMRTGLLPLIGAGTHSLLRRRTCPLDRGWRGGSPALEHMGQLMGQQARPRLSLRRILPGAKYQVASHGIGQRVYGSRRLGSPGLRHVPLRGHTGTQTRVHED